MVDLAIGEVRLYEVCMMYLKKKQRFKPWFVAMKKQIPYEARACKKNPKIIKWFSQC